MGGFCYFFGAASVTTKPAKEEKSFSEIFSFQQGLNPITTAANPLLLIVQRLRETRSERDLEKVQSRIVQELQRFEATLRARSYAEKDIFIARYLLCATLDDAAVLSSLNHDRQWEQNSLLNRVLHEPTFSDRFVGIVSRALQESDQYHELLELAYLCLRLGYSGLCTVQDNPEERLRLLASELFFTVGQRENYAARPSL